MLGADVPFFPTLPSVTSHWELEISHGGSVYTMKIGEATNKGFQETGG